MSDRPTPVKHALNNPKIRLSAPNPQLKGTYATLSWDVFQNNPRIVVDTKDPSLKNPENNYGRITAPMDPLIAYSLFEELEWAISLTSPDKHRIWNGGADKKAPYNPQGPRPQPITTADVWIGRDAEMNVFISVLSPKDNLPKIKFVFGPADTRFVKYYGADGNERTKAEVSSLFAKAYLSLLKEVLAGVLVKTYEHIQMGQFGGGGGNRNGGGGYNRGGNGGGGYNQNNRGSFDAPPAAQGKPATDDFEDDTPF